MVPAFCFFLYTTRCISRRIARSSTLPIRAVSSSAWASVISRADGLHPAESFLDALRLQKDVIFVRLTGGARWIRTLERLCKRSASYSKASKSSKWLPQRGAEQILSLETLARWGLSSSAYFRDHLTGFLPARSAAGMSEHFLDWYPTDGEIARGALPAA